MGRLFINIVIYAVIQLESIFIRARYKDYLENASAYIRISHPLIVNITGLFASIGLILILFIKGSGSMGYSLLMIHVILCIAIAFLFYKNFGFGAIRIFFISILCGLGLWSGLLLSATFFGIPLVKRFKFGGKYGWEALAEEDMEQDRREEEKRAKARKETGMPDSIEIGGETYYRDPNIAMYGMAQYNTALHDKSRIVSDFEVMTGELLHK